MTLRQCETYQKDWWDLGPYGTTWARRTVSGMRHRDTVTDEKTSASLSFSSGCRLLLFYLGPRGTLTEEDLETEEDFETKSLLFILFVLSFYFSFICVNRWSRGDSDCLAADRKMWGGLNIPTNCQILFFGVTSPFTSCVQVMHGEGDICRWRWLLGWLSDLLGPFKVGGV